MSPASQLTEVQTELEFRFFGEPEFRVDKLELHLPIRKLMALMAYLAVEGSGSRSKLAGLLWSELDETSARRNLRQRLYRLSPPELTACLQIKTDQISLGAVSSDVQKFAQAIQEARFAEAVALYKGVFLDGLELEDASAFHDWLDAKRDAFARQYQHALAELAHQLELDGQLLEALQQHLLLIAINPLLELHQRQIMRLHLQLRQPAEGLAVFERFKDLLVLELGLEPTPETLLLATQMRQQENLEPLILEKKSVTKVTRAVLIGLPMIGREGIWQQLEQAWQEKQMIFISGEPGMGKSRLLQEFAATRPTLSTLGRIGDSSLPFATQTRAIRGLLELNPQIAPPAWIRQELSRLIPALHDAPPADRPESRLRLFDAFTELLWMTTQDIDTHLIDDLQFFDADSIEMLLHGFSRFSERPNQKRQILAFRHGELSLVMQHHLDQAIQNGKAVLLELEPLDNLAVQHLVEHLFGANQDLSSKLHQATRGNPFFALETLKTLVESEVLQQNSVGTWDAKTDLPMPQSVTAAVRERVARLGTEATRLLETASLAGDTFTLADIQSATTLTEFQALEAFEKALALQLLEQQANGYRFTHDLVRESLALGLGTERRRLLHQKLAIHLEQYGGAATRIAGHLEQAGQAAQAIGWRIRAAEEAGRVYAHREALRELEFALNNGAIGLQAHQIYLSRELLFRALGDSEARAKTITQLVDSARALQDSVLENEVGIIQLMLYNDRCQAFQGLQTATKLLEQPNLNSIQTGQVLIGGATALLRLDQVSQAETWFNKALLEKQKLPHSLLAAAYSGLRICAIFRSDFASAHQHIRLSLQYALEVNDLHAEIEATIGTGRIEVLIGQYTSADQTLESGLKKAQAIGDSTQEFYALCSLAWSYALKGQFNQCLEFYKSATALNLGFGNAGFTIVLETYYSLALQYLGKFSQSLIVAKNAIIQAKALGSVQRLHMAQTRQADLYLALGDSQNAIKQFTNISNSILDENLRHYTTPIEVSLARCKLETNHLEQATQHLRQALSNKELAMNSEQRDYDLTQARLEFRQGNPELALETTAISDEILPFRAQALTLRLEALHSLHAPLQTELESAQTWLETPEIPALERLELQKVVIGILESLGQNKKATTIQTEYQQQVLHLSSTLEEHPELQKCFLEKFSA